MNTDLSFCLLTIINSQGISFFNKDNNDFNKSTTQKYIIKTVVVIF